MGIVVEIAQSFELAPTKDLPDYTRKNPRLFHFPVKENKSKKFGRVEKAFKHRQVKINSYYAQGKSNGLFI